MALTINNQTDNINIFEASFKTGVTYGYTLNVTGGELSLTVTGFNGSTWVEIPPSKDSTFYVAAVKDGPENTKRRLRFTFTPETGGKLSYEFSFSAA